MKKALSLLVTAIVAQGLTTSAMAEGPIDGKIYGKLNTALIMTNTKNTTSDTDDSEVMNNASRLGFVGKTELNEDLNAVYRLEYEIAPDEKAADDGGSGIFKQRNAYVGLASEKMGTILLGSHDTPLKKAQGKVDLFNDVQNGDIKNIVKGETRANNVIVYISPRVSGISLMAANVNDTADGADGTSVSVNFKNNMLYVAAAMDNKVGKAGSQLDIARVAASVKLGSTTLGVLHNESENSDGTGESTSGTVVSASQKVGNLKFKVQLAESDESKEGGAGVDTDMALLGIDYKLGKQTKLFAFYSALEYDTATDDEITTMGLGMEHKF